MRRSPRRSAGFGLGLLAVGLWAGLVLALPTARAEEALLGEEEPFLAETARVETAATRTVRVLARGFQFEPAKIVLTAGEATRIELVNEGPIDHVLAVEDPETGDEMIFLHARPGETAAGTYRIDAPRTYETVCNLPQHAEAGMVGLLVVKPAVPKAGAQGGSAKPGTESPRR